MESIFKGIKRSFLVLGLLFAAGCASTQTDAHLDNVREKERSYFEKCKSSEKLWTGITSPFMAAAGLVSYHHRCLVHHQHSLSCELVGGNIPVRVVSGVVLLGQGAYNLATVALPLPSAAPSMRDTVIWAQENISDDAERYKNWLVRFYTPYGETYTPYKKVERSEEQKKRDEEWKKAFYEYYHGKVPEEQLLKSLEQLP